MTKKFWDDREIFAGMKAEFEAIEAVKGDFAALYRLAFELYECRALWNVRNSETPTPGDALAITQPLRIRGNLATRYLAEQIERVCNAPRTEKIDVAGEVSHPEIERAAETVLTGLGFRNPAYLLDLLAIHEKIAPLGAVLWVASQKTHGFTPEGILNEIRRLSNYRLEELQTVSITDPKAFYARLWEVLAEAENDISRILTEHRRYDEK